VSFERGLQRLLDGIELELARRGRPHAVPLVQMAPSATLRASDADRDAVAGRLHEAAVEGRLEPEELEERLHAALRARTYGDLRRLVADLPANPAPWAGRGTGVLPTVRLVFGVAVRIAVVLAAVAAVVAFAVFMTASWVLWAFVFVALRSRRVYRHGSAAWCPPHPRRVL
jgi:Flp pilus assembly protein TadB